MNFLVAMKLSKRIFGFLLQSLCSSISETQPTPLFRIALFALVVMQLISKEQRKSDNATEVEIFTHVFMRRHKNYAIEIYELSKRTYSNS